LGINAFYGLHPTVASFLGISLAPKMDLNPVQPNAPARHQVPLWESWKPPAELPAEGTTAQVVIPPQSSGFASRPAGLYLPLHGRPETFINRDVVDWARSHLNIIDDRKYWTIAGYSHGGQCAISFAAKHPSVWGNVLDISGEEYPGAEEPETNLREMFGGSQSSYDAVKPINILKQRMYPDTDAIFTASTDDAVYLEASRRLGAAATAAGMTVTNYEVPNGGHVIGALNGALNKGFEVLYPRLGLSRPGPP
jgi:enterochelin esterase-like enzyme